MFKNRYLFENKYQQTLISDMIIKNRLWPIKPKGNMKNKIVYIDSAKANKNKKLKIAGFFALSLLLLSIGYFGGRLTVQAELKEARIITTRNMLLINDHQCSEKLKSIMNESNKGSWF